MRADRLRLFDALDQIELIRTFAEPGSLIEPWRLQSGNGRDGDYASGSPRLLATACFTKSDSLVLRSTVCVKSRQLRTCMTDAKARLCPIGLVILVAPSQEA